MPRRAGQTGGPVCGENCRPPGQAQEGGQRAHYPHTHTARLVVIILKLLLIIVLLLNSSFENPFNYDEEANYLYNIRHSMKYRRGIMNFPRV